MFEVLTSRTADRFTRIEPRCQARDSVLGLLSDFAFGSRYPSFCSTSAMVVRYVRSACSPAA
jgi:hypothetical protein